jgi:hypothetical protein
MSPRIPVSISPAKGGTAALVVVLVLAISAVVVRRVLARPSNAVTKPAYPPQAYPQ